MEEVNGGGMFVKVMTDEQIEVLRKQIAVYATICEQLVERHKLLTSQNDLVGVRMGNMYCDPLLASGGHKMTGRQRWTPTPLQLQILERTFDQENGTPSKQKIKEMASDLSQHGQISETNVYNWFQNRRARSKRKQQAAPSNNGESEVETEAESSNEKKTKPDDLQAQRAVNEDGRVQNTLASSGVHSVDPRSSYKPETLVPVEASSRLGGSFGQMPFYDTMLQNPRMDNQLMGKMKRPDNYNPYLQQEDYSMAE